MKGLDNLLTDIERGQGNLSIRQTTDNFVIGRDIATTPGKVVFSNELIELIQYTPTTETVYKTPLLIFPPWINKFYILDLQPKNSFVKWAVERGYTVFVVSWVNPDPSLAEKDFDDYMREGIFAALDAVEKATGEREANAIGYCIGGTLLGATLAYIAASGEYQGPHQIGDVPCRAGGFLRSRRPAGLHRRRTARRAGAGNEGLGRRARRLAHGDDVQPAARQRSDLVVRDFELPDGQGAGAVRPALLEFRHHAHAAEAAPAVSAPMLPRQRAGPGRR